MLDVVGVENVQEQDHQVRRVEVPEMDKENQGRIFLQPDIIPTVNFPTTNIYGQGQVEVQVHVLPILVVGDAKHRYHQIWALRKSMNKMYSTK